jgi:hypothetical protein
MNPDSHDMVKAVRPPAVRFRWSMVVESLSRPYPVSISMIVLVLLVPFYIFIPELTYGRTQHVPALAWDRVVPVQPPGRWSMDRSICF